MVIVSPRAANSGETNASKSWRCEKCYAHRTSRGHPARPISKINGKCFTCQHNPMCGTFEDGGIFMKILRIVSVLEWIQCQKIRQASRAACLKWEWCMLCMEHTTKHSTWDFLTPSWHRFATLLHSSSMRCQADTACNAVTANMPIFGHVGF